jgi:hypothetical protein
MVIKARRLTKIRSWMWRSDEQRADVPRGRENLREQGKKHEKARGKRKICLNLGSLVWRLGEDNASQIEEDRGKYRWDGINLI